MASSFSNDVRSSELPLAFAKNGVAEENISLSPLKNGEIPSTYVESSTAAPEDGISSTKDAVDSALLCAMRDQRERVALLRLEQTMVDFMKEDTTGYIEVGGPGNAIVISPSGNIGKNQPEQLPPGRQTSFQRCCLHRLADRFGIVRETNLDGMIRLVKVKESAIPKKLLIDLDPSEYAIEYATDAAVRGLVAKLSDSSIGKGKKMKIMKRSSSGLGSSNSLKSEGKGTSSRSRKKLLDKEKAYAEARARIFSDGASDTAADAPADTKQLSESVAAPSFVPTQTKKASTPPPVDQTEADDKAAVNKATWRNRREEENDPDFQRLAGPSSHYGIDTYAQQTTTMYGYNPQQQHFYPTSQPYASQPYGNVISSAQYAAASYASTEGQTYCPAPSSPYYRGRTVRSLSRQSSSAGDESKSSDVINLDEFPSLS